MVDASERLQVLLTQESTFYKTSDYLTRMQSDRLLEAKRDNATTRCSNAEASNPTSTKKRKSLLSACEDDHSSDACTGSPGSPKRHNSGSSATSGSDGSSPSLINKHWREKICEWAYQGKYGNLIPQQEWRSSI